MGNIELKDLFMVLSMLLPDGMLDVSSKRSVMEWLRTQHNVKVAQSILAHILSVVENDLGDHLGSFKIHLPPGLTILIGVRERSSISINSIGRGILSFIGRRLRSSISGKRNAIHLTIRH